IKALLPYAMTVAAQGPGPISNQLFWWRDGEFIALPAEEKDQQITFSPPIEFIEMMNSLAPVPPVAAASESDANVDSGGDSNVDSGGDSNVDSESDSKVDSTADTDEGSSAEG
ncbi:MAG: hypothetical protein GX868_03220, partial [Actinobacteria bacterium]|nr:hypothetical protein [Actinomycetota bacterium]